MGEGSLKKRPREVAWTGELIAALCAGLMPSDSVASHILIPCICTLEVTHGYARVIYTLGGAPGAESRDLRIPAADAGDAGGNSSVSAGVGEKG